MKEPYSHGAADKQATPAWRRVSVPWFILGFLALVVANSFVTLPTQVASRGLELSKFLLLLAVTATAMRSQLGLVIGAGWRPLVPVLAAMESKNIVHERKECIARRHSGRGDYCVTMELCFWKGVVDCRM